MSNQPVFLAKHGINRYVVHCNHGLIHLHWERARLQMCPADFVDVVEFLRTTDKQLEPQKFCRTLNNFVMECPEGQCMAWIIGLGLYISRSEFHHLTSLMSDALRQLKQSGTPDLSIEPFFPNTCNIYQVIKSDSTFMHLNWSQVTVCLGLEDFWHVVDFFQVAEQELLNEKRFGGGEHFVERDDQGCFQIWLHGMGFYLNGDNFDPFLGMINQAAAQIRKGDQPTSAPLPSWLSDHSNVSS